MSKEIIVFTALGCKYCAKAKTLLQKEDLPFTALDVDFFPDRYKQAAAHTKVGTVPLIFFGNDFKGGASELEEYMKKNDKSAIQRELSTIDEGDNSKQLLKFLSLPLTAEEVKQQEVAQAKRDKESDFFESIELTDLTFVEPSSNVTFTYSQILYYLRYDPQTAVQVEDRGLIFKKYRTVQGDQLLNAISKFLKSRCSNTNNNNVNLKELSRKLAIVLSSPRVQMFYDIENSVVTNRSSNQSCSASNVTVIKDDSLYRFTVDAQESGEFGKIKTLNGDRTASSFQVKKDTPLDFTSSSNSKNCGQPLPSISPDQAISLSRALWRTSDDLCNEFRDSKDQLVEYAALYRNAFKNSNSKGNNFTNNKNWRKFKDLACLLQAVDLKQFNDKQKIAFGINLYNTAVYCGFFEFLVPWSNMQKLSFFGGVGFFIGNDFFSLNDIENGFLRGNRKGVTDFFSCPISSSDPRLAAKVQNVDFRIHFGLNCGAKSCPPVKVFSAENLDHELDLAAKSFIQSSSKYDAATNKISTSQILKWYKEDFNQPSQNHNTQDVVLKYLYADDVAEKENILKKNDNKSENIGLVFSEYDWGFNAKKEE